MATTRVRNVNPPFYEIIGHDHIKKFFHMALITDELTHILLTGLPASAKTMFLLSLKKDLKNAYFINGGNTTTFLLNLMETGIVSETKFRRIREAQLRSSVLAF